MSPALGEADGMLCNRLQPFHPSYQVFLSSRRIDVFKVTKGHRPRVVFHAVQP